MKHFRGVKRAAAWLPLAAMTFAASAGCNKEVQHAPDVWAVVNGKEIKSLGEALKILVTFAATSFASRGS